MPPEAWSQVDVATFSPAQTQPLRSRAASCASKGQGEYQKIHVHEKSDTKFFQKYLQPENPKFCFPPEGLGFPHTTE